MALHPLRSPPASAQQPTASESDSELEGRDGSLEEDHVRRVVEEASRAGRAWGRAGGGVCGGAPVTTRVGLSASHSSAMKVKSARIMP